MIENSLKSNAPLYLKNVGYFNGSYLGDLIILKNSIYYVAHTNLEGSQNELGQKISLVTRHFGLLGFLMKVSITQFAALIATKPSQLAVNGILQHKENISFEQMLDGFVEEMRRQAMDIDQYGLIKPLKFTRNDVKNVKVGLRKLKFDSEYDNHDFNIGLLKTKSVKDALHVNGFVTTQ